MAAFSSRLSHLLSDDWKKDKKQEWKPSDFGDCAKLRYKVRWRPARSLALREIWAANFLF
jgi:hypothetical protein